MGGGLSLTELLRGGTISNVVYPGTTQRGFLGQVSAKCTPLSTRFISLFSCFFVCHFLCYKVIVFSCLDESTLS